MGGKGKAKGKGQTECCDCADDPLEDEEVNYPIDYEYTDMRCVHCRRILCFGHINGPFEGVLPNVTVGFCSRCYDAYVDWGEAHRDLWTWDDCVRWALRWWGSRTTRGYR